MLRDHSAQRSCLPACLPVMPTLRVFAIQRDSARIAPLMTCWLMACWLPCFRCAILLRVQPTAKAAAAAAAQKQVKCISRVGRVASHEPEQQAAPVVPTLIST